MRDLPSNISHLTSGTSIGAGQDFSPEEVFLELFRQAIDSATEMLQETGLSDEAVWATYRAALEVLNRTTCEIDVEAKKVGCSQPRPLAA